MPEEENVSGIRNLPTDLAQFAEDERISYSRLDGKYIAEQDDGTEYEFDMGLKRWALVIDEDILRQHQAAYGGGEEQEEDGKSGAQGGNNKRKRKNEEGNSRRANKRQAMAEGGGPAQRQNTAVYVTGIPLDATAEEVAELFSRKCGVIAEEIDGNRPRIKMYTDSRGTFKGDALIVFFKPQSVDMAIMLLDDTEFRFTASGLSAGKIRVQAADASYKKTNYDQGSDADGGGASNGGGGGGGKEAGGGRSSSSSKATENGAPPPARSAADKHKIIKKTQKLDAKLADWDDDDADSPFAALVAAEQTKRDQRHVVLRHMFTLQELEDDPAALLEIKEDIRDECEKLGEVTNVVLYDMEEGGIVTVKFRSPESAQACIALMHGRSFDGRTVVAELATGKEKFRRSKDRDDAGSGEE